LAGCAEDQQSEPKGADATIVNHTNMTIGRIVYEACGRAQDGWAPLPTQALGPGQSAQLTLPPGCIDLNAFYGDGRLAGSQRGVDTKFPFRWDLE
jgi:hypothetical protein